MTAHIKSRMQNRRGFILIAVMLALIVVGAIAYLLNREGAMNVDMAVSEADAIRARYVAEAGLAYATAQINAPGTCAVPTFPIALTLPNGDSFSVSGSTASTSPLQLNLTSVSTLAGSTGAAGATLTKKITVYTGATQQTTIVKATNATALSDTYISYPNPTINYGTSASIFLDNGPKLSPLLFGFNLTPDAPNGYPLPANAKLLKAELKLFTKSFANSYSASLGIPSKAEQLSDVTAHKITSQWNTTATWNLAKTGSPWNSSGTAPTASYIDYKSSGSNTSTISKQGGGDYDPAYVSVQNVDSWAVDNPTVANRRAYYTWNITPLVAEWIAGADNYGIDSGVLLKAEQALGQAEFYSSEDNSNSGTNQPQLILTSQVPCAGPTITVSFQAAAGKPIRAATINTPIELKIDLFNPYSTSATLSSGLTITLPAGVTISSSPAATCAFPYSVVVGPPAQIVIPSGNNIPAYTLPSTPTSGLCNITVPVIATALSGTATLTNLVAPASSINIAAGALKTNKGNNATASTASVYAVPMPTLAADNQIFYDPAKPAAVTLNWGTEVNTELQSGLAGAAEGRTLLLFNALPVNVQVQSAKLFMYVRKVQANPAGIALMVTPNYLTKAWVEGTSKNTATNGSSWNNANAVGTTLTPWGTAGGSFSKASSQTTQAVGPYAGSFTGFFNLDVAPTVQQWANGTANYGFILTATTTATTNHELILDSKEAGGGAPNKPYLQMTYQ